MLEEQPVTGQETLRFDNLSFYIEDKTFKEKVLRRPGRKKCILENISGAFQAGEIIAFMGASGCGKTTLMDILACRKSYGIIEGEITYSGQLRKKLTNSEAGYVPQADIAMANLTVRETINYAIRLRVPNMSREEMDELSTKLMEDLMISHCANTRVGNDMMRGISGGELRRLSIAQDLVNNPSLLFLDEPTSGLDSYASFEVVSILKRLAKSRNQLIIMTIHQPSPQIFYLFDKLLLLTKSYSPRVEDTVGRVGYYGPISEVAPYFEHHLRIPCPPEVNIADHIINETSAHRKNQILLDEESKARREQINFADKFEEFQRNERRLAGNALDNDGLISMSANRPDELPSKDETSASTKEEKEKARAKELKAKRKEQKRREKERWEAMNAEEKKEAKHSRQGQKYPTSMLNQFITLTERSYIDAFRSPDFIFNRLVKPHLIGFIIWTIYFQLSYSPAAIQNRVSCVFFTLLSSFMLSQALIPVFIVLRPISSREKGAKLYGAFVQMFVQLAVIFPIELVNGFIYITYINWATHLFPYVDRYFMFALMYLSFLCLMMLYAMMVGAISTTGEKAAILAPIFFLFALVVCGFFILISVMPPWWSWARWISPLYYALSASMYLQFHDITWNCTPPDYNCTFADGNAVLAFYSADLSPQLYWAYQSAVWGYTLLCGTILYCALRFIKWDRR